MTLKDLRQQRQGRHGAGSTRRRTVRQRRAAEFAAGGCHAARVRTADRVSGGVHDRRHDVGTLGSWQRPGFYSSD